MPGGAVARMGREDVAVGLGNGLLCPVQLVSVALQEGLRVFQILDTQVHSYCVPQVRLQDSSFQLLLGFLERAYSIIDGDRSATSDGRPVVRLLAVPFAITL